MDDYMEDYASEFYNLYGRYDYVTFKNNCLTILYGKIPSYALFYDLETETLELKYWDQFTELQLIKICDEFKIPYNSLNVIESFKHFIFNYFFF